MTHAKPKPVAAPLLVLGVLGVSACSLDCDPSKSSYDTAVLYDKPEGRPYSLPLDTWTKNPKLEAFLRKVVEREGAGALAAKYNMRCSPQPTATGCPDCLACTKTSHDWRLGPAAFQIGFTPIWKCVDYGEILVQADVGPGRHVSAMTYWKTTSEVSKQ
jgi:hypothetical protein